MLPPGAPPQGLSVSDRKSPIILTAGNDALGDGWVVRPTVVVDAALVGVLQAQFGRHCTVLGPADGDGDIHRRGDSGRGDSGRGDGDSGSVRVRVAADTALSIARNLAGWGAQARVDEPAAVRTELARLGAELVDVHG